MSDDSNLIVFDEYATFDWEVARSVLENGYMMPTPKIILAYQEAMRLDALKPPVVRVPRPLGRKALRRRARGY